MKREKKNKNKKSFQKDKFKETFYVGEYKHLKYFSSLELATILHCESLKLRIENYDGPAISYFDPLKKRQRKYNPDFLIENFLIAEVKWLGFVYEKKKLEIEAKRKSLEGFCKANEHLACVFVTNELIKRKFLDKAKLIHKEKYDKAKAATGTDVELRGRKREGQKKSRKDS
jgi:hypothetical protein